MNKEKEFKTLSAFLKKTEACSDEVTANKRKLSEFVVNGIIELQEKLLKKLPEILSVEIVAMLTRHSTGESLFNKIDNMIEQEIQTKNTPAPKIIGNPYTTFQLQSNSNNSIPQPTSHLNRFSLN